MAAKEPLRRRGALRAFAFVVAGAFAAGISKTGEAVVQATPEIIAVIEQTVAHAAAGPILPEQARKLFPNGQYLKVDVGTDHPNWPGRHPDNVYTAGAIYTALGFHEPSGHDTVANFEGTILVVGSPTSDNFARQVFGFGEASTWPPPNPWNLPILYDHHDQSQPMVRRWLGGKEHRSRRKGIIVAGESETKLVRIGPNNIQLEDYLLVTVLPNFLDWNSARSNVKIWVIGGAHGIGTRAFTKIFQDPSLTGDFLNRVTGKGADYFQALFKIPEISHDDSRRESLPMTVSLEDFEILPRNEVMAVALEFNSRLKQRIVPRQSK